MSKYANVGFDITRLIKNRNTFRLANEYDRHDNVESIHITKLGAHYQVNATVNVLNKIFNCRFLYDAYGRVFSARCFCPYSFGSILCAHVGAVLIKLNNLHIDTLPYRYEKEKVSTEEMMHRIEEMRRKAQEARRLQEEEEKRQRLLQMERHAKWLIDKNKIEYNEQMQSNMDVNTYTLYPEVNKEKDEFVLSYRIGTDKKKYVVRNIFTLIENFENRDSVVYGKNMIVFHDEKRFDEDCAKQLDFMKKVIQSTAVKNRSGYYNDIHRVGKEIYLNQKNINYVSMFADCYLNKEYETFKVEEGDDKVQLHIYEDGAFYNVGIKSERPFYVGKDALYFMPKEDKIPYVFTRVEQDENRNTYKLLSEIMKSEKHGLYIPKSMWNDFYKYMIVPCEKCVELKEVPKETIPILSYDKIQLYGDIDDHDQIEVKVQYVNEDGTITPAFQEGANLDFKGDLVEGIVRKYAQVVSDEGKAYFDASKEETIDFFKKGIENISPYCEIYVSEALRKLNTPSKITITVGVKVKNDLLELDIDSLEIPKEELSNVLSAYHKRKRFYRLKNGELLNLNSQDLEELDQFMEDHHLSSKDLKKEEITLNKNRMFALEEKASSLDNVQIVKEDSFKNLLQDFKTITPENIEIPEAYNNILRDYQKDGYRWLYTMHQYGFNGILADDMGLGKTLQVIALLDGLNLDKTSIVICPASLIYNWEEEVHKFSKRLKIGCVVGNKNQRKMMLMNHREYDLLVTSYDYMRRDYEDYDSIEFAYVILDEAQNIKNQRTKNADAVKTLKAEHRLALTGTPIENTLAELWSIFDFLMPDYLYNYSYFKKTYETPIVKHANEEKVQALRKMVSPFILRRNKKDVLKELPDKIESVQFIPFEAEENKLYLAYLSQANERLQEILKMEKVDKIAILSLLTRLRQLCVEPRMIYENIEHASSKMNALLNLLVQLKSNGQKTLVFSAFPSVFDFLEEDLRKEHISYMKLTGSNSKEERKEMVEKFQNEEVDVFLISLKAGGTGLNLTAASAVIHIDPWWNLSAQNQATDRAHRIGQVNNVQVFKMVMKNSIEEKILKLQEKKANLADQFVERNEGSITRMSNQEIVDLFKM